MYIIKLKGVVTGGKNNGKVIRFNLDGKMIEEFAMAILALTNARSNNYGVLEIKTVEGSNTIIATITEDFYDNNKDRIESLIGKITYVEDAIIYELDTEDIAKSVLIDFDKQQDRYFEEDGAEPILCFNHRY